MRLVAAASSPAVTAASAGASAARLVAPAAVQASASRMQTAVNGRDAVKAWRKGGFHLVLMDIQLPIMSGLDATREIRRLERVNSIGVFSSSPSSLPEQEEDNNGEISETDKLENYCCIWSIRARHWLGEGDWRMPPEGA